MLTFQIYIYKSMHVGYHYWQTLCTKGFTCRISANHNADSIFCDVCDIIVPIFCLGLSIVSVSPVDWDVG
jgi:hypothetical protein